MWFRTILVLIVAVVSTTAFAAAQAPGKHVVSASSLNARLAANQSGQLTRKLYRGSRVEVREVKDGWARISDYYSGADEGLNGFVAQWVFARHLRAVVESGAGNEEAAVAKVKPPATAKVDVDSPIYKAISSSDDLEQYAGLFVQVSEKLVKSGLCSLNDFVDIGGWWRSNEHNSRLIYYTYCGGATNENRIFVDVATGQTFR